MTNFDGNEGLVKFIGHCAELRFVVETVVIVFGACVWGVDVDDRGQNIPLRI